MVTTSQNPKRLLFLFSRCTFMLFLLQLSAGKMVLAQCLSSVNPVGGTENVLALEKKALRVISFYKYGQGSRSFEGSKHSDYDLISKSAYHYSSALFGYGLTNRTTVEMEWGYYFDKSQVYNIVPPYTLSGSGLSNCIVSLKYNLYRNHNRRIYFLLAGGVKIPFSTTPKMVNYIELPIDLQPSIGAFGIVFNSLFVKENSEQGHRFFITNRVEANRPNVNDYRLGTSLFTSFYFSKHLMAHWIKGDWTAIFQLRNEIRMRDRIAGSIKESSGGTLFVFVPQINYVLNEKWFISAMFDVSVYQYFNGTQMGNDFALTFSLSRTIKL